MSDVVDKLLDEETIVKPIFYWVILFVLISGCLGVEGVASGLVSTWWIRVLVYIAICGAWTFYWLKKRFELPNNPIGRVGIIIAVETEDEDKNCRNRLADFTNAFRRQIADSKMEVLINVFETKNYQAKRLIPILSDENAAARQDNADPKRSSLMKLQRINKKVNGHLYIYGRLSEREQGTKYVIDFDAFFEQSFSTDIKKRLSDDYSLLWSKRRLIDTNNEINEFVDSAQHYYLTAKYIIGYVAFYSGNAEVALFLHSSLRDDIKKLNSPVDTVNLLPKLERILSTEFFAVAYINFLRGKLDQVPILLRASLHNDPENADAYMLAAVTKFWMTRDCNKALQFVYQAKEFSGGIIGAWRYSEAFLFLYTGRHEDALRSYGHIIDYEYEGESVTVSQVIEFNKNLLRQEPRFFPSYFVLGLIKYKKELNVPEAYEYFGKFLKLVGKQKKYRPLKAAAKMYKREIDAQMQLLKEPNTSQL